MVKEASLGRGKEVTTKKAKRKIEAGIIMGKASLLAGLCPDLKEEILATGESLKSFIENPKETKAEGAVAAIESLMNLEGEEAERAREGFADVLWYRPEAALDEKITSLIKGLANKDKSDSLLELRKTVKIE